MKNKMKFANLEKAKKLDRVIKNKIRRANYSNEKKKENNLKQKEYRIKNKEQIRLNNKNRYNNLTEEQKDLKRKQAKERQAKRYASDINYRLGRLLRSRLNNAIKGNYKSGSAVDDLGCSIEEFKKYIESKFEPWMTWDNWGSYDKDRPTWQIDHIKALANVNLENREEFLKVNHYSNMRPLLAIDNLLKSNREQNEC